MGRMKLKKTIEISNIDKIIVIFIIVIASTFIRIKTFSIKSNSILLNFAKNQSTKIATTIINISLKKILEDDMTEVMQIKSDKYGNVLRIDFNNKKVNRLNYQINNSILSSIKSFENGKIKNLDVNYLDERDLIYKVPIGIIYDIPILVDISAKIPIKTSLLSNVESSILTRVKEYGINNSLIEIYAKITLNVQVILPFSSEIVKVIKEIPIDSKVVQGKIPQYYGGVITNTKNWLFKYKML